MPGEAPSLPNGADDGLDEEESEILGRPREWDGHESVFVSLLYKLAIGVSVCLRNAEELVENVAAHGVPISISSMTTRQQAMALAWIWLSGSEYSAGSEWLGQPKLCMQEGLRPPSTASATPAR